MQNRVLSHPGILLLGLFMFYFNSFSYGQSNPRVLALLAPVAGTGVSALDQEKILSGYKAALSQRKDFKFIDQQVNYKERYTNYNEEEAQQFGATHLLATVIFEPVFSHQTQTTTKKDRAGKEVKVTRELLVLTYSSTYRVIEVATGAILQYRHLALSENVMIGEKNNSVSSTTARIGLKEKNKVLAQRNKELKKKRIQFTPELEKKMKLKLTNTIKAEMQTLFEQPIKVVAVKDVKKDKAKTIVIEADKSKDVAYIQDIFYYQPVETEFGTYRRRVPVGWGRQKGFTDDGQRIIKVQSGKEVLTAINEGKTLYCARQ